MGLKYILLLFILFIPLISAHPPFEVSSSNSGFDIMFPNDDVLRVGESYNFEVKVFNKSNGVIVTNFTSCYFDLYGPQGSLILSQIDTLVSSSLDYSFNVDGGNFTSPGDYRYVVQCNSSSIGGFSAVPLILKNSGEELTEGDSILYAGSFIALIVIFGLCLYGAIVVPWNNERDEEGYIITVNKLKYVKVFLAVFSYAIAIMISFLLYNITWGYFNFNVASNIFYVFYWLLLSLFFPIIVVALLIVIINFVNDKKLHEAIGRGLPIQ